jgi:hypothetical protein
MDDPKKYFYRGPNPLSASLISCTKRTFVVIFNKGITLDLLQVMQKFMNYTSNLTSVETSKG